MAKKQELFVQAAQAIYASDRPLAERDLNDDPAETLARQAVVGNPAACAHQGRFAFEIGQGAVFNSMSAAFSPIMIDGALVLPDVSVGMIEASAIRRPLMP